MAMGCHQVHRILGLGFPESMRGLKRIVLIQQPFGAFGAFGG
jgi:hypothetical protein